MLFGEMFVQGFISAKSDVQSLQFCAWCQSCWCRVSFFFRDLQKPGPVSHSGVLHSQLSITWAVLTPAPLQLREALPEVIQASMTVLVDSWEVLHHPAAPGLLLSLPLPSFPLLFKNIFSLLSTKLGWNIFSKNILSAAQFYKSQ